MQHERFKTPFAERIFRQKYSISPDDTWDALADRVVDDVCGTRGNKERALLAEGDREQLAEYIKLQAFIPGGRYLYYSGRPLSFWNNCYLLRCEEDTREEWANIAWRSMNCLTTGGGIGVDYSRIRPSGRLLSRTGGTSSGPLPLMYAINEIGRSVMQGGSRRSAIYASLNFKHEDIPLFLKAKNWSEEVKGLKSKDFNFPAHLDMTNISVNYDDDWLWEGSEGMAFKTPDDNSIERAENPIFLENCRQAMMTGEPGFSFNFGRHENETLRNACTEVTSADDSDV